MAMLINAGSHIGEPGAGWTSTVERARAEAARWLERMYADGLDDVELLAGETEREGRWAFAFRHKVTGACVELEAHGIDDVEAYERERVFTPCVYWDGSSTSSPELEQFAAPGFRMVRTFVPAPPSPAQPEGEG